jgi:hypothetical protein
VRGSVFERIRKGSIQTQICIGLFAPGTVILVPLQVLSTAQQRVLDGGDQKQEMSQASRCDA